MMRFTEEHEWVRVEGAVATVGITNHAQDALGDITYVELPKSGKVIKKARLSVIHNGVVVQWGREFDSMAQEGDLGLQDHHNPIRYRNIWIRPINLTDPDSEGTPPPSQK